MLKFLSNQLPFVIGEKIYKTYSYLINVTTWNKVNDYVTFPEEKP